MHIVRSAASMKEEAKELWRRRVAGVRGAALQINSIESAYHVQHEMEQLRLQPRAAWKVGATTAAAVQRLGLRGPFAGRIFADAVCVCVAAASLRLQYDALCVRGVEAEVGLRVGVDIDERRANDLALLSDSIASTVPIVEVVSSRFAATAAAPLPAPLLIADTAGNGALVLGAAAERVASGASAASLAQWGAVVRINGKAVASGSGSSVMGSPLLALQWLAKHALSQGTMLRAGEVISTGTMVDIVPVAKGDHVEACFNGADLVSFKFE